MDEIRGLLIVKIVAKGTLSEGPEYWLQPSDDYKERWDEILVRKEVMLWQNDPVLHGFIGKKVLILGEVIETKSSITIDYKEVKELSE